MEYLDFFGDSIYKNVRQTGFNDFWILNIGEILSRVIRDEGSNLAAIKMDVEGVTASTVEGDAEFFLYFGEGKNVFDAL